MSSDILVTEFQGRTFTTLGEWSGRKIVGRAFDGCVFHSCYLGMQGLAERPILRNIRLQGCQLLGRGGCTLKGAIVEDVLVEDLKTDGLVQTWATVFKHVTLKGKIGELMFSSLFHPGEPTSKFQRAIEKANADYYATVDWALDIREAELEDIDCRGLPARLVRRNPETQMMLTRDRVLANQDAINAGGQYWAGLIKFFLGQDANYPYADAICVVPRKPPRGTDRNALTNGIEALRKAGVAEPD